MTTIALTPDQLRRFRDAHGEVVLVDDQGCEIGFVSPPLTPQEWDGIQSRIDSEGPWYSTNEVLSHLQSLGAE